MPEDQTPQYEPVRQYLLTEGQVRAAFILSFVGMTALLLVLLFVATARPQARLQALSGDEFQAGLRSATARLEGYELFEDGRARLDIGRAMALVAERGVVDTGAVAPGQAVAGAAPADAAPGEDAVGAAAPAEVDGAQAFTACAACHMATGAGVPGAFPPLARHAADLHDASRTFLIDVVMYGMTGQISVDGVTYNGLMPSHAHLSDAELAAILNHVMTSFGNEELATSFEDYSAAEVEARRGQALSFTDVYAQRQELSLE